MCVLYSVDFSPSQWWAQLESLYFCVSVNRFQKWGFGSIPYSCRTYLNVSAVCPVFIPVWRYWYADRVTSPPLWQTVFVTIIFSGLTIVMVSKKVASQFDNDKISLQPFVRVVWSNTVLHPKHLTWGCHGPQYVSSSLRFTFVSPTTRLVYTPYWWYFYASIAGLDSKLSSCEALPY